MRIHPKMKRVQGTQRKTGAWWPILRVDVSFPEATLRGVPALVDSGADHTLVSPEVLEKTGVGYDDLSPPELAPTRRPLAASSVGLSGEARTHWCPQGSIEWDGAVVCSGFLVPEEWAFGHETAVVLGYEDFFSKVVLQFHWGDDPPVFYLVLASEIRKR